jgi:hypothetical protein
MNENILKMMLGPHSETLKKRAKRIDRVNY